MPTAAVIATQLTDRSARPFTLTIAGTDMLGLSGSSYRVPVDTIRVEESGPGGVSSMSFTIWDPLLEVTVPEMAVVEFWDQTNDLPIFAGFVQALNVTTQAIGRWLEVECVGIEAVLDWMVVPSLTIPAGTKVHDAIQSIVANAIGVGVSLRVLTSGGPGVADGTQAEPIGVLKTPGGVTTTEVVTIESDTVREAIRSVFAVAPIAAGAAAKHPFELGYGVCTVDFWYGLRVWRDYDTPDDYATLTVSDTTGAAVAATILDHAQDWDVPRAVYVKGGNEAGSGTVSDGSGISGRTAVLEDSTILTSTARDSAGQAYLTDKAAVGRGSLSIENYAATTNVRAGSLVVITSVQVGLAAQSFAITGVSKTFTRDGKQSWRVAYGGLRPSALRQLRRLTRRVLS